MRHKVVLYNPKAVFWTFPLALMAIASALDRQRYEVVIVDGRLDSPETLLHHLQDALCLGITVLTGAPIHDALAITQAAQERFPQLPIVWGGWHPSLFPEMCVKEAKLTAAVMAQGEETFSEIVDCLAQNISLATVAGCAYADDVGQVIINPPRLLRDINELPRHNYGLIPVEQYFQHKGQRQLDYISSQGCHFRCSFCADPAVYKRGWFGLAPERMVTEIQELWTRYQFTDLAFQDETFFTHKQRVIEIAEGFLATKLPITWFGTMRADQGRRLDDETLALCKRSGLRRVMIGLEAGSQAMIDAINKDIKLEDMWLTAEKLIRHNIGAVINVIVGFPDEPPESVRQTIAAAQKLRAMSPDFELALFYFKPYPGNPIAYKLQQQGYQFPNTLQEWANFDYVGSSNPWLTPEQKEEIEHFKFYQRFAYDSHRQQPWRWTLQQLSRWRVTPRNYRLPWEQYFVERIKPPPKLS